MRGTYYVTADDDIKYDNLTKYLKSPTLEQVEEFRLELGITKLQFERYYGMPRRTLNKLITDTGGLPVKFWHIIYEKIVPTYGIGFKGELDRKKKEKAKKVFTKERKQKVILKSDRLEGLK